MKAAVSIVLLAVLWAAPAAGQAPAGLRVEAVEKGTPAHDAGLQAGDVLASWSRSEARPGPDMPAGGALASPFDLTLVELQIVPRVPVVLSGLRDGKPLSVRVEAGEWNVRARPLLSGTEEETYRAAAHAPAGEAASGAGLEAWRALIDGAGSRGDWTLACWLAIRAGQPPSALGEAEAAGWQAGTEDACAASGRAELLAFGYEARARAAQARRRFAEADAAWRQARAQWRLAAPDSLAEAAARSSLGTMLRVQGRFEEARGEEREALRLRQALAPDSLEVAASLNNLGGVALALSEPEARSILARVLAIRQRLAPNGLSTARSLSNLSLAARREGDLAGAADFLRQSLALASRLDPGGPSVVAALNNLGVIENDRGDAVTAEGYYQKALALAEQREPGGYATAANLNNLAELAMQRGEWEAAETYFRRSLDLFEKLGTKGLEVAGTMSSLGLAVWAQGKGDAAEDLFRRSLALSDKVAPDSITSAATVMNLMRLAVERGDEASFPGLVERAKGLLAALPPAGQFAGRVHTRLGDLEAWRGDLAAAERSYAGAVDVLQRVAPFHESLAQACYGLGEVHRRQERWPEAVRAHLQAIETVEAQAHRLRGGESRVGFGVRHARMYQAAVETLLEAGRPEEAFHYWERSRARALLDMMAERDLAIDADLPADLRRRRRAVDAEYERAQASVLEASPDVLEARLERLRQLRAAQQDLAEQARQASPRLAAVVYPQPLRLEQAVRALDPGTVLLAFAVGEKSTRLFVVEGPGTAESLAVFTVPAGESALRERVSRYRALITTPSSREAADEEAQALYALLLGPAEARVARARRLLICADGPLHLLPFAALRRPAGDGRPAQYLVEWKPLHLAGSVTVYAQLKKPAAGQPGTRRPSLVAFGDPHYGDLALVAARLDDPNLRRAARRGKDLSPLPGTRAEVQSIARLFPRPTVYLGREATEERAKAIDRSARYVHFASHALLDESSPLDSALALTAPDGPGRDNGLLQAWEIIEQLRIDADLVTLSACESAGGREAKGEGLLGLTRAFHYAGARSVLSSLWSVSDDSTAVLMKRFYAELRQGQSKDEALRLAQLSLVSHPRYAQPGDWAAFALSGDWR